MTPVGKRRKWRQSRCTTKDERRWSQLPTLFIWMVKDCLNLSDNAHLSSVCKNWNSASRDYKPEPRNHPALPWILHMNPGTASCELINFSTMEKIVLHTPELDDNLGVLFSRRGWLLLQSSNKQSVLLFNLLNNVTVKIEIPKIVQTWWNTVGSFSLKDDDLNPYPHHLALVNFEEAVLTLFMVDVGSKECTKYQYKTGRYGTFGVSLLVVKNHVFILDKSGTTYIFDMMTAKWKEIAPLDGRYLPLAGTNRMTQTQVGEIVQIVECFEPHTFKVYKLDDNKTCWEELRDPNMNWFISPSEFSNLNFVVEDLSSGRNKAHQLDCSGTYMERDGSIKQTIYVHNTGDKSVIPDDESCWSFVMDDIHFEITFGDVEKEEEDKMYVEWFHCGCQLPSRTGFKMITHWLDLGWIDKVPPSCIGTRLPPCTHSYLPCCRKS